MNDPIDPPRIPRSESTEIKEVGEEQLEEVTGGVLPEGVLTTPGRTLKRVMSAPGKLQGNHYITPEGSPASPAPSGMTDLSWGSLVESYQSPQRGVRYAIAPGTPSP